MQLISDSILPNVVTISVAVLTVIVFYFKYLYTYWSSKNVVSLPPSIPFGNFGPFIRQKRSFKEFSGHLYKEFKKTGKPYGGLYMFSRPVLILMDPELCKHVMTKDFQYFTSRGTYCDEENEPLTGHLLNLNGNQWKTMRGKLTPTFTSGKMKMMFETLVACSHELGVVLDKYVENGEALDVKDTIGRFTTDIIGSCAFGLDCNSLKDPDNQFRKYGKRAFEPTFSDNFKSMVANSYPKLFSKLGLKKVPKEMNDFFMNVVKDTVDYREKNNYTRNDFMQLLIQLKAKGTLDDEEIKDPSAMNLTMGQVAAQAFVFFLAGFETSSTTMSGIMYELATHQDVQDKLRDEINEVLRRYNGKITYEGIMEMAYMDKVLDEAMRIHAIAGMIGRQAVADYKLPNSDLVIQKGTRVFVPVQGFHMDPDFYPNPEQFNPERFSPEEKAKRHQYVFLPFGAGPRNCIGLRFGMMQMKVGLSALLKDHKFTLNSKTQLPLVADPKSPLYTIKGSIWVDAERLK